jgi:hypothetical protein
VISGWDNFKYVIILYRNFYRIIIMFSPSVSLISSNYLLVHSNNVSAKAEAATASPPPPPAVFFFLFSTKGPFQGHTLPLQGN